MKRTASALLIAATLMSLYSCGTAELPEETTPPDVTTPEETKEFVYEYPELDLGGGEFTILNGRISWGGFIYQLDFDSQNGETLNDAIYDRDRKIEEKFGLKLSIVEEDIHSADKALQRSVMAQDDTYKAAFIKGTGLSNLVAEEYLYDLSKVDTMAIDESWWDGFVREEAKLGKSGKLYFAASDISLVGFQGSVAAFFNENKLADLGLDTPYQLVRDGKWTLDALSEYMKAGANLNGDSTFAWNSSAAAEYGLATWTTGVSAFITGCDESFIDRNESGDPILGCRDDRFFGVLQKLAGMFAKEGEFLLTSGSGVDHYETIFANRRALMLVAELKASSKYRDIDFTFGIVPMPKYDESQESYYCYRWQDTPMLCIPVTNSDPASTGAIMDAMAYISYDSVLPVFYENTMAQKQLRNDESIEMLAIIRDSRSFNTGRVYGWTEQLSLEVEAALKEGRTDLASLIEGKRSQIEQKIKETMEVMNK